MEEGQMDRQNVRKIDADRGQMDRFLVRKIYVT